MERAPARHEDLLPLIDQSYASHEVGTRFALIDDRGTTRRAVLDTVRPEVRVLDGGCAPRRGGLARTATVAFPKVAGGASFLLLHYRATRDLELFASANWLPRTLPRLATLRLPAGSHTWLIPIEVDTPQIVAMGVVTPGARLCVQDAAVVRPLLPTADAGTCQVVDRYGRPGFRVPCP